MKKVLFNEWGIGFKKVAKKGEIEARPRRRLRRGEEQSRQKGPPGGPRNTSKKENTVPKTVQRKGQTRNVVVGSWGRRGPRDKALS